MSPLRPVQRSQKIYKASEAGDGLPQEAGHSLPDIPGRHAPDVRIETGIGEADPGDLEPHQITRLQNQLGKIAPGTNSGHHVPRVYNRFCPDGADTTRREGTENCQGLSGSYQQKPGISEGPIEANWEDVCDNASNLASSTVLQRTTGIEEQGLSCIPVV